jgi:hypothetical protein
VKPMYNKKSKERVRCPRDSGMLLIECLVYIALLFIVLNLAFAAWFRCSENSKRLNQNVDDVVRVMQAGERWRDDIRVAMSITASGGSLELAQSNATVSYVFESNAVLRRAKSGAPLVRFLTGVKSSRMEKDARLEAGAWDWQVQLLARGAEHFAPFFAFEAVAAGDRQK